MGSIIFTIKFPIRVAIMNYESIKLGQSLEPQLYAELRIRLGARFWPPLESRLTMQCLSELWGRIGIVFNLNGWRIN